MDLIYEEPEIIDMVAQPWPPLPDSELQESDDLEATESTDDEAPYFEGWEPSQELADVEVVDEDPDWFPMVTKEKGFLNSDRPTGHPNELSTARDCDADDKNDESDRRRRLRALAEALAERPLTPAAGELWGEAWRQRFECWYMALPGPTQMQLGSCMGALGLHLGDETLSTLSAKQLPLSTPTPFWCSCTTLHIHPASPLASKLPTPATFALTHPSALASTHLQVPIL